MLLADMGGPAAVAPLVAELPMLRSRREEKRRGLTMLSRVDDSPQMDADLILLLSLFTVFPIKYEFLFLQARI